MIGQLIFIRHGEAESIEQENCDKYRELTEKGREQIYRILPKLKENIGSDLRLKIYASSLLRSTQTAEIIADFLYISEIEEADWVASGSYEGLREEIEKSQQGFCIIIAGHEPYLNFWSFKLCGYNIPYDKASVVCFDITSKEPLEGTPIWFAQPENMSFKYKGIDEENPIIKDFQKIISYQLQDIYNKQAQFRKFSDNADIARQLCAKFASFRSSIRFFKSMMNEAEYENVQNQINDIIRDLNGVYEMDLLCDEWRHLATVHPELVNVLSVFLTSLQIRRKEEKERIYNAVHENITNLLFKLLMWVKAGNIEKNDLQNLPAFKELRWSMLSQF